MMSALPSSGAIALIALTSPATAQPAPPSVSNACAVHAQEAASRSDLSVEIVMRVMMAESGGDPRIVSPKGAMGCMQIMPATWTDLAARYELGADPFNARSNMIGGAMYLAELAARYGWPGALSAYNAGPGRYQRHVQRRDPLPAETIAYTARLGGNAADRSNGVAASRWQEARLFIATPAAADRGELAQTPVSSHQNGEARPHNPLFPLSGPSANDAAP